MTFTSNASSFCKGSLTAVLLVDAVVSTTGLHLILLTVRTSIHSRNSGPHILKHLIPTTELDGMLIPTQSPDIFDKLLTIENGAELGFIADRQLRLLIHSTLLVD